MNADRRVQVFSICFFAPSEARQASGIVFDSIAQHDGSQQVVMQSKGLLCRNKICTQEWHEVYGGRKRKVRGAGRGVRGVQGGTDKPVLVQDTASEHGVVQHPAHSPACQEGEGGLSDLTVLWFGDACRMQQIRTPWTAIPHIKNMIEKVRRQFETIDLPDIAAAHLHLLFSFFCGPLFLSHFSFSKFWLYLFFCL